MSKLKKIIKSMKTDVKTIGNNLEKVLIDKFGDKCNVIQSNIEFKILNTDKSDVKEVIKEKIDTTDLAKNIGIEITTLDGNTYVRVSYESDN